MRVSKATEPEKKMIAKAVQPVPFEEDHEEEIIRQYLIRFLNNLVGSITPESEQAYEVCRYIEKNLLNLPELSAVFPSTKPAHKKKQEKSNLAESEVKGEIDSLNKEIKRTEKTLRGMKEGATSDTIIALNDLKNELDNKTLELEDIDPVPDYKYIYPLVTDPLGKQEVRPKDWAILKKWLGDAVKKENLVDQGGLFSNLDLLSSHLGFDQTEKDVLNLLVVTSVAPFFSGMIDLLAKKRQKGTYDILARMAGVSRQDITKMLQPDAPLSAKGMIYTLSEEEALDLASSCLPELSDMILDILREQDLTVETISKRLIGEPVTTELDWDRDFSYLGERGEQLIALLIGAKDNKAAGINTLLYGLPDTGKTEAVKAAAAKVGLSLYMVGEKAQSGAEPDRQYRMQSALLAQALLADKPNAAILFDEMEDLLPGITGSDGGSSKVFLNRLLENNKTITFWTANNPENFHPAVLRRMRYSIEFRIPPASVREKMWASISARHDFTLSAADATAFARQFIAPPGMITTAVKNATLSKLNNAVPVSLAASADLVFGNRNVIKVRDTVPANYDLRLLVAKMDGRDLDIQSLGNQIKETGHKDFSMLIYGPPGTGKSAYVAYLARELGMEPLVKRASDLLGMYVGESEKNIAKAFQEAVDGEKFLIIDEADTFMTNREKLEKSWERSAVNEMLTQIEHHPYPIAMTTNLMEAIDPAAKRRFQFKLLCDYMTPEQTKLAFEIFFGRTAPESLTKGPKMTPSDFSTVKKQSRFMAADIPDEKLVELLHIEAKARGQKKLSDYSESKMGFGGQIQSKPA